jgi:hypothetical protein
MNVSLRDTARSMPEQSGDRKFRKPEVTSNTRKGVAEDMWGDPCKICLGANSIEYSDNTDEVPIANISRKQIWRLLVDGLVVDALHRRAADHSNLLAALGIRKVDRPIVRFEPRALETKHLHPPKACKQEQPYGAQRRRMLARNHSVPHHLAQVPQLVSIQPPLHFAHGDLANTERRILLDETEAGRMPE